MLPLSSPLSCPLRRPLRSPTFIGLFLSTPLDCPLRNFPRKPLSPLESVQSLAQTSEDPLARSAALCLKPSPEKFIEIAIATSFAWPAAQSPASMKKSGVA